MLIEVPRPSSVADPLDALADFHSAVRDVAAWARFIVDDTGVASPRDAHWLRAFLLGPLAWHLNDEELFLFPRLSGTSPLFDRTLESCLVAREALEAAAAAVCALTEPIGRGDRVPPNTWSAATQRLEACADRCLSLEDAVVLPTARLRLDADARGALHSAFVACEAKREWGEVERAADDTAVRKVHVVRVRAADGRDLLRPYAECPKQRTVDVNACRGCHHLEDLHIDTHGRGRVACAIDPQPADSRSVSALMTRDVAAVEPETPVQEAVALMAERNVSGLPVLDPIGKPVGMVTQTDVVRMLAEGTRAMRVKDVMMHVSFVVHERDSLDRAVRLLTWEGVHRVGVVNDAGQLVGVLGALDVIRALALPAGSSAGSSAA